MDCPTCGLVNPPSAVRCDCGHDFAAGHAPATPGWPIDLSWSQKVAAFYAITWPVMLTVFFAAGFFVAPFSGSMHTGFTTTAGLGINRLSSPCRSSRPRNSRSY